MGPQAPKDVTKDTARDLSGLAGELAGFKPHLLIHNDTVPVPERALSGVPSRVEISYSDGMSARVVAGGVESGTLRDISTEDLLRVVAVAARKRYSRRS